MSNALRLPGVRDGLPRNWLIHKYAFSYWQVTQATQVRQVMIADLLWLSSHFPVSFCCYSFPSVCFYGELGKSHFKIPMHWKSCAPLIKLKVMGPSCHWATENSRHTWRCSGTCEDNHVNIGTRHQKANLETPNIITCPWIANIIMFSWRGSMQYEKVVIMKMLLFNQVICFLSLLS